MSILPVHNLVNTGQSLRVTLRVFSALTGVTFKQKYGRVETQLKNICFFVTVATIPALKMTHLSLA